MARAKKYFSEEERSEARRRQQREWRARRLAADPSWRDRERETQRRCLLRRKGVDVPELKRGKPPIKCQNIPQMGSLEGWQDWDVEACERLAAAIAEAFGHSYRIAYREYKKAIRAGRVGDAQREEQRMERIKIRMDQSPAGVIFDVDDICAGIRRKEDEEWKARYL